MNLNKYLYSGNSDGEEGEDKIKKCIVFSLSLVYSILLQE